MKTFFPLILIGAFLPAFAHAQQTVAPTTGEATGSVRGDNVGTYNIVQQWELGYRFASVGGDSGSYRSDVNYHNGIRLLNSSLTINSRDGHGKWFDEITLSTQGLGHDPYESATFRIQKNQWYRYDLLWRSNDYFNPGLTVANGEHLIDTNHRWQDHELTLLPQNWYRLRVGYGRTAQDGPALNTATPFDSQGAVFPVFHNVRQQFNEYRVGGDATLHGFRFSILRRWEFFKEDSADTQTTTLTGAALPFSSSTDPSVLTSFNRSQPYRGDTRGWLANLSGERKFVAVNARFSYSGGRGDFVQNERALGIDRFSNGQNRQIAVTGNGTRPVTTGDLNLTLFPASKLSVINTTSISNTRISGNNHFVQFDNATLSNDNLNFQFLGIRLITNATDVKYRFTKRLDAFAGYRYSNREIRSIEDSADPGQAFQGLTGQQTNVLQAGVAGVNWILLKDLRLHVEGEIGRDDHPFAPNSLANYHAIRARVRYAKRKYSVSGGYQQNYNNNSIQITAYSSHSRNYNGDATWNAKSWLALDASYSNLHLDTIGGLQFFAGSPRASLVADQSSYYISNIHAANLGLRIPIRKRADLYAGYSLTRDAGDSRAAYILPRLAPGLADLYHAETFPLTYQTPLLRLSVQITPKLRYNLGYQYYGYHEDFGLLAQNQNYRAHTGYTSLLWSF